MLSALSIVVPAALALLWVSRASVRIPLDIHIEVTDADLAIDLANGFERNHA